MLCRIRPPDAHLHSTTSSIGSEKPEKEKLSVTATDPSGTSVDVEVPPPSKDAAHYTKHKQKRLKFTFDRVFDSISKQEDVFQETLPAVHATLNGLNACVFAFGQSGSGKTYTMEGLDWSGETVPNSITSSSTSLTSKDTRKQFSGIIPKAIDYIFSSIESDPSPNKQFMVCPSLLPDINLWSVRTVLLHSVMLIYFLFSYPL